MRLRVQDLPDQQVLQVLRVPPELMVLPDQQVLPEPTGTTGSTAGTLTVTE